MLRLKPTTISLTMAEVKDVENRRRYRRYLQREGNLTSEETVRHRTSPTFEPAVVEVKSKIASMTISENKAESSYAQIEDPLTLSSPFSEENDVEDNMPTPTGPGQVGSSLAAAEYNPLVSPGVRFLSMSPRRLRQSQSPRVDDGSQARTQLSEMLMRLRGLPPVDGTMFADQPREIEQLRTALLLEDARASSSRRSSRELHLPPPFSQTPRVVSGDRVPSSGKGGPSREAPNLTEQTTSPGTPQRSSANHGPPKRSPYQVVDSQSSAVKAAARLAAFRSKGSSKSSSTISQPTHGSAEAYSSAEPSSSSSSPNPANPITVYDDLLPPRIQPQTPEQLPEARHRSRLPESYTAPVTRSRVAQTPIRTPVTARRFRRHRVPSPTGMRTPGFQGLYGGRENADDVDLFQEGIRASGNPSPNSEHSG